MSAAIMSRSEHSKRAASILTIAQHKFKQALKKEDADSRLPPVAVELSSQLLSDIDAVLSKNTPLNVQKCTGWIVKHIAPSKPRIASLGDYMLSVSKAVVLPERAPAAKTAARTRFAFLLIINDVLHTERFHQRNPAKQGMFSQEAMSFVPELVELAASCVPEKESQAEKKLRALLNYWALNQLVTEDDFRALRDRVDEALLVAQGGTPVRRRHYLLPEYHGDRHALWHDLPASYMLESMIKHPNRPIDPRSIKIAKLDKKPVSAHVRNLLDNYFENIDLKYLPTGDNPTGETRKYKLRLDPMGQLLKQDKDTGETSTVCNGYGWSVKMCQDMQKDGVPEIIRTTREEIQREEELETNRLPPQQRRLDRRHSQSPRRRRSPSSDSDYGRTRGRRSHSRTSSRSSYDSRHSPPSTSRTRTHSHRTSPGPENRNFRDWGTHHDDRDYDRPGPPLKPYDRDSSGSSAQWNGQSSHNRDIAVSSGNKQYAQSQQNSTQGNFQSPQQQPFSASLFPPPPAGQYPGSFTPHPFPPPPPPFQPGAYSSGIPPPPPPNFSGPFPPPPPHLSTMSNNPYNLTGNQFGNSGPGNNFDQNQTQNHVYSYNQGNFQGGRGGFRGNFHSGGNNRGSYRGQRGQRGGRW